MISTIRNYTGSSFMYVAHDGCEYNSLELISSKCCFLRNFWDKQILASVTWYCTKFSEKNTYHKKLDWLSSLGKANELFLSNFWNNHISGNIIWNWVKYLLMKLKLLNFCVSISRKDAESLFSSNFWKKMYVFFFYEWKFSILDTWGTHDPHFHWLHNWY